MAKRLFDLLLTLPGLLLLLPLMAVIALWVRLDSPGPVLFRQQRVGRGGVSFALLKFRSMRVDAEKLGPKVTVGADPRITRSGQLLRKSKLDELPQLFNVVMGQMSLVGPRPEVPEYVAHYPAEIHDKVLSVLPGITDLASIEFRNENAMLEGADDPVATYLNEIMPIKLDYYVSYVEQRSLWLDLKIIFRTFWAVVSH
ncbi:MAG: sugar transferase [Gammaproteobacteria bacterium (ex Lamellibrachia satsuma)]|nr:MAG: sugar transferase [Gammaproteobacteria bacterium (ex Lamellibrachia satsuma)]RRS33801.1 MAG: sugar transferase [Gammaproteobacteria bacterium (ex Lamellibrachia satsuma)]RRS37595.1 MAG: sugar transferase [Gammaproteobacteria bacterium (ex Lamellibrachia satsuma)]